jgi:ATP-binding cassette subfamily F protein 3
MSTPNEDTHQQLLISLLPVLATVEDLDDDTLDHIAGMISSQAEDNSGSIQETIDDILLPFLESVGCPDDLKEHAEQIVRNVLLVAASHGSSDTITTTRTLLQGVVNMKCGLANTNDQESKQLASLWGTDTGVKAMANSLIDAHDDKASARDKRKARKADLEMIRKQLLTAKDLDPDQEASGGLVKMSYMFQTGNTDIDKKRDVQVRQVTLSLDNGTVLLENGELKFAYQRRYGLIGENGIGKSSLLRAIANGQVESFPRHLRVLHVRQEVPSHITHDMIVVDAVLQADIERMELIEAEKAIIAKLEKEELDLGEGLSLDERRKKLLATKDDMNELTKDLKRLDEIYARLQILGSDNAEAKAAMILTGLQFSPEMQQARISSLSGGWRMRVALAAALFIEPEICMVS